MTLEEAIKILGKALRGDASISYDDWEAAHKLGIEGLKRLQKCRKAGYKFYCQLMLGETKE